MKGGDYMKEMKKLVKPTVRNHGKDANKVYLYVSEAGSGFTNKNTCAGAGTNCTNEKTC